MLNILVTGATGFVGKRLIEKLIKDGYHITAIVRNPKKLSYSVNYITLSSIDSATQWQSILKGHQVVIHLASQTHGVKDGRYLPLTYEDFYTLNVEGTRNLAKASQKAGVKHFIYLSSIKAQAEFTTPNQALSEYDKENPLDDYGKTKLLAEKTLIKASKGSKMSYTILRPPLIYGPGVKGNFKSLLKIATSSWPLPFAHINNLRSFIYVDNLIDAITQCIKNKKSRNQTFLIQDLTISTSDLISIIRKNIGLNSRLFRLPYFLLTKILSLLGRKGMIDKIYGSLEVNDSKIRQSLHWRPLINAEEGLKNTTTWYCRAVSKNTHVRG